MDDPLDDSSESSFDALEWLARSNRCERIDEELEAFLMKPAVKPPGKSRRLLSSRPARKAQKIADLNASRSPLLRLPAEIRNRVLSLVLGGHQIHIGTTYNGKIAHSICKAPESDGDAAKSITAEDIPRGWREMCERHTRSGCGQMNRPNMKDHKVPLDSSLLFVCRQMHRETAILPFTQNTFVFDPGYLARFSNSLLTRQRKAVANVSMRLPATADRCWVITVAVDLLARGTTLPNERYAHRVLEEAQRTFARLPIQAATECVDLFGGVDGWNGHCRYGAVAESLLKAGELMEGALLKSWQGETKTG